MIAQCLRFFNDCERLVLKDPELDGGQGVIILKKHELRFYLKLLSALRYRNPRLIEQLSRRIDSRNFRVCQRIIASDTPHLLLEEYITSKLFIHDGAAYDPTMRVYFLIVRSGGQVRFHPLIGYWRLPRHPHASLSTEPEQCIPSYDRSQSDLQEVVDSDLRDIYRQLAGRFPTFFQHILQINLPEFVEEDTAIPPDTRAHTLLRYATALSAIRQFDLARSSIAQTVMLGGEQIRIRAIHEQGILAFKIRKIC